MDIGEKIKKIRKNKGLTQKDLAIRLNVSEAMVSQYESKNSNLRLKTIQKIAFALGVEIEDIIGLETFESGKDFEKRRKEILNEYKKNGNGESLTIIYTTSHDKMKSLMDKLNDTGKIKAIDQVELLTKIDEYTKKE